MILVACAAVVAACGGGGGGGGGTSPPPVSPPPPSDTTFGTLALSAANADALPLSVSLSEGALAVTQTFVNAIVRYAGDGVADRPCGNTGSVTVNHQDTDSSFSISTGDFITVTFIDCFDPSIDGIGDGTAGILIANFALDSATASIAGDLGILPLFQITDRFNPSLVAIVRGGWDFSFSLQSPEVLTATATGMQRLAVEIDGITETITDFAISKTATSPAPGSPASNINTDSNFDLSYDSELFGGTFSCESSGISFTGANDVPDVAFVLCRGLNSSALRVQNGNEFSVDPEGDASYTSLGVLDWNETLDGFLKTDSGLVLEELVSDILVQPIAVSSNDVVYDAGRDRLLVTTTASDAQDPFSLLSISLSGNGRQSLLTFNDEPNRLQLSDDGSLIYVSFSGLDFIQAYDAVTLALVDTLTVQSSSGPSNEFSVIDIAVSPQDPSRLAVSFRFVGFGTSDIVIFESGVQLPSSYRDVDANVGTDFEELLFAADGLRLFATDDNSNGAALLVSDNAGIQSAVRLSGVVGSGVKRFGDRLQNGASVLDGDTFVRIGSFASALANASAIDDANGFAYDVRERRLRVYDSSTYAPLGDFSLAFDTDAQSDVREVVPAGSVVVLPGANVLRLIDVADLSIENTGECVVEALTTNEDEAYTRYACPVVDAIYDPLRSRIYAAIGSDLGVNGNSIAVINAVTGAVESYVNVGSEPKQIELAADGNRLHILFGGAEVIRTLDLVTLSIVREDQIELVNSAVTLAIEPRQALDLSVFPLETDAFVATLGRFSGSPYEGLAAWRDGSRLPDELSFADLEGDQGNNGPQIVFDSGGSGFSISDQIDRPVVQSVSLTPTGLASGAFFEIDNVILGRSAYDTAVNEVFTPFGAVIDLAGQTGENRYDVRAASFAAFGDGYATLVDSAASSVYLYVEGSGGGGIARYDLLSGALNAEQVLGDFVTSALIAVGADRIGFVANGPSGLIVIDKAAIQ